MPDLTVVIHQHLNWYPLMELRDVYKLIYQGVLGSEHLVSSTTEFASYLEQEFEHLVPDPAGRLAEPVRPDGGLLRINLRPYKSRQQDVAQLVPLCLETAAEKWGKLSDLQEAWDSFVSQVKQSRFPQFTLEQVVDFTSWLEAHNYPALHHSEIYRQHYQPAYRLISSGLFQQLKFD